MGSRLGPAPTTPDMNINEEEQQQAKEILTNHLKTMIESDQSSTSPNRDIQEGEYQVKTLPFGKPTNGNVKPATGAEGKNTQAMYCPIVLENNQISPRGRDSYNTVPLTDQPYRTMPLVLPNPKTIHDTGETARKYV